MNNTKYTAQIPNTPSTELSLCENPDDDDQWCRSGKGQERVNFIIFANQLLFLHICNRPISTTICTLNSVSKYQNIKRRRGAPFKTKREHLGISTPPPPINVNYFEVLKHVLQRGEVMYLKKMGVLGIFSHAEGV